MHCRISTPTTDTSTGINMLSVMGEWGISRCLESGHPGDNQSYQRPWLALAELCTVFSAVWLTLQFLIVIVLLTNRLVFITVM